MSLQWPYLLLLALPPVLLACKPVRRGCVSTRAWPNILRGSVMRGRIHFAPEIAAGARFPWRFWLAFFLAVVALARPQWGSVEQPAYTPAAEVLVALDLSRSMLASDVAPSRLERARARAAWLVEQIPEQRVGLIAFAGAAFLLAPASLDHAAVRAFLPELVPADIAEQGTDFAALIDVAAAAFSPAATSRCLVVLTDGETDSASWRARLGVLRRKGIRVIAVGFGTAGGANVPMGDGQWLRDSTGRLVLSRLNAAALADLSQDSRGAYLDSDHEGELAQRLAAVLAPDHDAAAGVDAREPRAADRFMWFLGAAVLLLGWSLCREWPAQLVTLSLQAGAHRNDPAAPQPLMTWPARRSGRGADLRAAAVLAVLLAGGLARDAHFYAQAAEEADEEDVDALTPLTELVARIVSHPRPTAADYLELVHDTLRYGDAQRGQSGAVSIGILQDGLTASERGRALDPRLADWDGLCAALRRLAVPPPPVPEGSRPADPANEPAAGSQEAAEAGRGPRGGKGRESENESADVAAEGKGFDSTVAETRGLRSVGGSRRHIYDAAEWRDPSLVVPLHRLEQLRGTDSPAELFRIGQGSTRSAAGTERQPW
jgi:Ca-activated chloride channel homolog